MIEKTVLDYLTAALVTEQGSSTVAIPVYMEMPEKMPARFVLVEKTGSGVDNRIQRATFALQSYAPSMYEAAELNYLVKAAMDAMPATQNVFRCKLNSDYNYTDTSVKRYRYQAVYDLTY